MMPENRDTRALSVPLAESLSLMLEVTKKDIKVHLRSRRLLAIALVFVVVFFALIYVGNFLFGTGNSPVYEQGANAALYIVMVFTSVFPALLAIALSYDSIVGERTNHSLHLMVSRPIGKPFIYLGKYLAIVASLALVYVGVITIGYLILIALAPATTLTDVANAYMAVGLILLGACAWAALTMIFSTILKTGGTALVVAILTWILILPLIAQTGFIYESMNLANEPEPTYPLSVSVAVGAQSSQGALNETLFGNLTYVTFSARELSLSVTAPVAISLYDTATSEQKQPQNTLLGGVTYLLENGTYAWIATSENETLSSGVLRLPAPMAYVIESASEASSLYGGTYLASEKNYVNDISITASVGPQENVTASIIENGTQSVLRQANLTDGETLLKDLPDGLYTLVLSNATLEFFNGTVRSYGEAPAVHSMPTYVKYILMLDPNNDISGYQTLLMGEETTSFSIPGALTIDAGEGALALCVMIVGYTALGIFLFRRIELF